MRVKTVIPEKKEILAAFSCDSSVAVTPLGCGNINTTYLVDATPHPFVLQKISEAVFPDPVVVIDNFEAICNHLNGLDLDIRSGFRLSKPVYTRDRQLYIRDSSGAFWRGQEYVSTRAVSCLQSFQQARSLGRTLARFHLLFESFTPDNIKDPLPGFHHLKSYLQDYDQLEQTKDIHQDETSNFCKKNIEIFRTKASAIEQLRGLGKLNLQLIHGDPKVDNFIFSKEGEAVGLLDLDTVGLGIAYHDLGDCLRSACSTTPETGGTTVHPQFDLHLCRGIIEGYFSAVDEDSCTLDPDYIYEGLFAICFELGLRFYTDHLKGDVYFNVTKAGENAEKAANQFRLCQDIADRESDIKKLVGSVFE